MPSLQLVNLVLTFVQTLQQVLATRKVALDCVSWQQMHPPTAIENLQISCPIEILALPTKLDAVMNQATYNRKL